MARLTMNDGRKLELTGLDDGGPVRYFLDGKQVSWADTVTFLARYNLHVVNSPVIDAGGGLQVVLYGAHDLP